MLPGVLVMFTPCRMRVEGAIARCLRGAYPCLVVSRSRLICDFALPQDHVAVPAAVARIFGYTS